MNVDIQLKEGVLTLTEKQVEIRRTKIMDFDLECACVGFLLGGIVAAVAAFFMVVFVLNPGWERRIVAAGAGRYHPQTTEFEFIQQVEERGKQDE